MPEVSHEPIAIEAPGAHLVGTLSTVASPRLLVLINGATGVKASFYRPFADWLAAGRQAAVLTWDYRDFGASGAPYGSGATMTDWAIHDATAARLWLEARHPGIPLWVIGHSLGGMAMAFQEGTERIARIITVAAGHGHVTDHPWPFQAYAWVLWSLLGPVTTTALGYFPGRRLRLGHNLPKGVFWQWRRWLLDRGALPADPRLGGVRKPGFTGNLTLVALTDDVMIPPEAVWKMATWHPAAQVTQRPIDPAEFGLSGIGHVLAFAPRCRAVWPALIAS